MCVGCLISKRSLFWGCLNMLETSKVYIPYKSLFKVSNVIFCRKGDGWEMGTRKSMGKPTTSKEWI